MSIDWHLILTTAALILAANVILAAVLITRFAREQRVGGAR
jgi:hypothetical protein